MIRLPFWNPEGTLLLGLMITTSLPIVSFAATTSEEINPDELIIEFADPSRESISLLRSELLEMDAVRTEEVYVPYVNEDVPGQAVPLRALLEKLEFPSSVSVLASSYDGYFSVFEPEFIEKYEPYLLLSLEDQEGNKLQVGKSPDLGPFYLTFAAKIEKGSPELMDPGNKRPYGVNWIKIGDYDELLEPLYAGSLSNLDETTEYGRKIYVNNCMSCHAFESTGLGGTFSNRTTTILGIHAGYNMQYFESMVKNPGEMIPGVLMSAHPHYTDKEIQAVAKFILAANENAKK